MSIPDLKDLVETAAACATVIAILVGGFWSWRLFVYRRLCYPRANVEQNITHRPLSDKKLLMHVAITISNTGEVLLSLRSAEIRVQQILPLIPKFLDCIKEGRDLVQNGQSEVEWPLLASRSPRWNKGECEIEPGESDTIPCDFVLDSDIQTVVVYSHFKNVKKWWRKGIGWCATTIYDLEKGEK